MNKSCFLFIICLNLFFNSNKAAITFNRYSPERFVESQPDTLMENQILYNGRVWKNLYYSVKDDQFLFSNAFLKGTVTINGTKFGSIRIKYDLYKDEILTPYGPGEVLQLNKETVDSFSIDFQDRTYRFTSLPEGVYEGLHGFVNVLYHGRSALYVKYIKKINRPGVENAQDRFYQQSHIYFLHNNQIRLLTSKNDLYKVMKDNRAQIRDFIKKNNLAIEKNKAESFVPVIRYYDSINQ